MVPLRHSLLARTLAVICLPLMVAVAIAVLAAITFTSRDAANALDDRARRIAGILAGAAAEILWNVDDMAARALLQPVANDPDFLSVAILDASGAPFAALGDVAAAAGKDDVDERVTLEHHPPGRSAARPIGTLELRLSGRRAAELAADRARAIALAGAVLLTVVAATLLLILRGVTEPVRAMTLAMSELAASRTSIEIPARGRRDEIGHMAAALATLREHEDERLRFIGRQSHLMEEIERTVEERTAELQAALDTLRLAQGELVRTEKMAALGGMVAAMAHEINTPLGNSLTVATTLADEIERFQAMVAGKELRRSALREASESFATGGRLLVANLTRAAELIGSFKRVAVDQTSELRRGFDLAGVCGEIVTTLWPSHKNSGVRIDLAVPPDIVMDSYPGALGQVLGNLVVNAFIHAFDGVPPGTIRIVATPADGGDVVMIEVIDDGRGIPAADLPRIFDPFFTTKLGFGGSGLGLHITYALVSRVLGGRITVASRPGEGTRFTMTLNRVAPRG
ncbi:ATP-binding protein [Skermanella stibiiresistens]|uniref:sensor histidine kinase n=1 Tax=Skermanella stibiiresistens TaxID=913326 RepID=UPI0012FACA4F